MKIFVTGGLGFIGSNFIRHVLSAYTDIRLVNFDKQTYAGNPENLKDISSDKRYTLVKADITDREKTARHMEGTDVVVHFAAETHVDRSIFGDCSEFVMTNTFGVLNLLNIVKNFDIQKFVNVSTDEVFGSLSLEGSDKFHEKSPIEPNMPYAAAKAGGDMMCRSYYATHKLPIIVTHCSNNYGSYQYPEKLIPSSVFRLLKDKPILMHGDGLNVRDWIYVKDHCAALDLLLHKGEPGEVYNIGADNEQSNLIVAKMIINLLNKPDDMIEFVEDRPGNDRRYSIDATKIKSLGWMPVYGYDQFEVGMSETINWYLTHKDWVEDLWKKHEEAYKINHAPTRVKREKSHDIEI